MVSAALAAAAMLASAGCMAPPDDELTKGVVSGEKPVAMEGSEAFFGGKIIAKVTLGRGIGKGLKRGKGERDRTYSDYANNTDKVLVGSPMQPITLHLILTNTGADAVTVGLIDFDSDMGNFAIEPDSLKLAPGQTDEPTAMVSQLGVSGDTIPFKVTLKVGGTKETKTVVAKVIPEAEKPGK